MFIKLLQPIDFRDKKLKSGDVTEMPEGLASKLILDGMATKATEIDKSTPKKVVSKTEKTK